MSAVMASEGCFMSALLPNTQVTAYAVPSDAQLRSDGKLIDGVAKAKRVQQQVQMRLAQRSSSLSRLNGLHCASAGPSISSASWKPSPPARSAGFSSASLGYSGSRTMAVPVMSHYSGGFSSRSAVESSTRYRTSQSAASTTCPHLSDVTRGGYHGGYPGGYHDGYHTNQTRARSRSLCQAHQEMAPPDWLVHQEVAAAPPTMQRSLSGTLARGGAAAAGWREEELSYQHSFKGPSHRTISRITNRQAGGGGGVLGAAAQQVSLGVGSVSGMSMRRAPSLHSMRSVGKGVDLQDAGSCHSNDKMGGVQGLDMATAVSYISSSDTALQALGAAYIQHQCYHSNDAKNQVRVLGAVPALVQLFTSESQEVQRFATGATRNLIYENMDNKTALMEAGGISALVSALREPDEELRKNITGILWNLSSKDSLKEKLTRETLSELTESVLVPLCHPGDSGHLSHSPSEADIFYNTTGCLRNLSSVSQRSRQQMRETRGLLDSLVAHVQYAVQEEKVDDKGVENVVCVLRNLSYQLYREMSPSTLLRLEGPTRGGNTKDSLPIGCFTPQSKKAKERRNQELSALAEVVKAPRGSEWLWHPQVVRLYHSVLQRCESNSNTREAATGALQNITTGDTRWASVLAGVVLDQERMLPLLLDLLQTKSELELRPLTGLLRNLARHCRSKDNMATKAVRVLVGCLPSDGHQKEPSSDVVVNICGTLNSLVAGTSLAARDICYFDGLPKLVAIKKSHDNSPGRLKAAGAASTVLSNMFQYNKLHRDYKQKGFTRSDFMDTLL
ncbi:plakophilin-3 [Osmerus mordax]|uniref:plakophilin-3 n=1 Tax=Osmerus mordax TaxID=8014 RepID=UPI00350F5E74